jgi:hypothetical protein
MTMQLQIPLQTIFRLQQFESFLLPKSARPDLISYPTGTLDRWLSYRQVQIMDATSGASGVTMCGFSMFREFGGAVHGSTHTPASSMS